MGCDRGGTHISEDQLIVEPVDLAGRPVPPGERSAKVYLTNLYNPVLPLIRYEITDEVTVLPEPCPCGSAHRRIADVQGRLDDVFVYQGLRVHPHLFRTALSREAGVVEYQVRQTPAGAAIAVRCAAPVSLDGLRDRIAAALARAGLDRPQVTVEIVDRLERPGGPAKLKRFIPLDRGLRAGLLRTRATRSLRCRTMTRTQVPPGRLRARQVGLRGRTWPAAPAAGAIRRPHLRSPVRAGPAGRDRLPGGRRRAGSVARWLAAQAGPAGQVVATDARPPIPGRHRGGRDRDPPPRHPGRSARTRPL